MATTKWVIDPTHSEIRFKVKHLMISKVTGQFKSFQATVETEEGNMDTAKIQFSAEIDSISTNNEQRDAHLRTGDFFDAENHPKLSFISTSFKKLNEEYYEMKGELTMRGVSKAVNLVVEFGGTTIDPWGNSRLGFSFQGKINRKDFGINFGMVSETGSILLGEEVSLTGDVELVKQLEAELV